MNPANTIKYTAQHTYDEVNLRAKFEFKALVAHELVHLNGLDNAELCSTLSKGVLG
jgi:hypothetical protein